MLRQAATRLSLLRSAAGSRRWLSTEVAAAPEDGAFVGAWKKMIPNIEPPKTPSAYMKPRPPTPSTIPSKLTVNLALPYSSVVASKEVDMIIVPATTGQMGVLPGHVPTIAELKPGILSVHEGSEVTKYFVSSGFAFVHANSLLTSSPSRPYPSTISTLRPCRRAWLSSPRSSAQLRPIWRKRKPRSASTSTAHSLPPFLANNIWSI